MSLAPDYAEPLLAWRTWRVARREGALALQSVVMRSVWAAGRPMNAECLHGPSLLARLRRRPHHQAPETRCECGIYGASLTQAVPYLAETPCSGVGRVLGLVALWGVVIECERGYRASCAYPSRIYVPSDASHDPTLDAAALAEALETYGVPVELVPADCRHAATALGATASAA
jgi:hypothetical protein